MQLFRGRWLVGLAALILVVLAGIFYATRSELRLFALDTANGRVVWSSVLPADTLWTRAAAVADGRIVMWQGFETGDGIHMRLVALEAPSGRQLWSYAPSNPFYSVDSRNRDSPNYVPLLLGDSVFLTLGGRRANPESIVALDLRTGLPRWEVSDTYSEDVPIGINTSAIIPVHDQLLTFAVRNDALIAQWIEPQTGRILRSMPMDIPAGPTRFIRLLPYGEKLVLNTVQGCFLLDPQTGAVQVLVDQNNQQAIKQGETLYLQYGEQFSAFDASTGQERWRVSLNDDFSGVPGYAQVQQQTLYVLLENRDVAFSPATWLLAFDTSTGKERWRKQVGSSGILYQYELLATNEAGVYVFDQGEQMRGKTVFVSAYTAADGAVRWRFPIQRTVEPFESLSSDGQHVYVSDRAARWQHWLTIIR